MFFITTLPHFPSQRILVHKMFHVVSESLMCRYLHLVPCILWNSCLFVFPLSSLHFTALIIVCLMLKYVHYIWWTWHHCSALLQMKNSGRLCLTQILRYFSETSDWSLFLGTIQTSQDENTSLLRGQISLEAETHWHKNQSWHLWVEAVLALELLSGYTGHSGYVLTLSIHFCPAYLHLSHVSISVLNNSRDSTILYCLSVLAVRAVPRLPAVLPAAVHHLLQEHHHHNRATLWPQQLLLRNHFLSQRGRSQQ